MTINIQWSTFDETANCIRWILFRWNFKLFSMNLFLMKLQTDFDESCFDETSNCFRWILFRWNDLFGQFFLSCWVLMNGCCPPQTIITVSFLKQKEIFFFVESFKKFGFWLKPFCDDGSRIMFKFYTLPSFDK